MTVASMPTCQCMQVNARASYSISVGGTLPDLVLVGENVPSTSEAYPSKENFLKLCFDEKQWKLHLLKAYHPLLLQRYHNKLQEARKNVAWATSVGALAFVHHHNFFKKHLIASWCLSRLWFFTCLINTFLFNCV